jgi:hypothetical protein
MRVIQSRLGFGLRKIRRRNFLRNDFFGKFAIAILDRDPAPDSRRLIARR